MVSQYVLVSRPIWGSWPDIYYCLTVTGFFLWGALSEERTGLSFVYAAGPCQRSLSRVRVAWDSPWEHVCLRSRYSVTALVYFLISTSFPAVGLHTTILFNEWYRFPKFLFIFSWLCVRLIPLTDQLVMWPKCLHQLYRIVVIYMLIFIDVCF
jgi:hypothetical protein